MQKESVLYGVIGLLLGGLLTGWVAVSAVNNNNTGMMRNMGMRIADEDDMMGDLGGMQHNMEGMTAALEGKTGEAFDKAFINEMIPHHQGAIDMANLAKQNAKHDEIKSLADTIIAAQAKEIADMRAWQKAWGY